MDIKIDKPVVHDHSDFCMRGEPMSLSRIFSATDLETMVSKHEQWIRSNKTEGNQADFANAYLEGRDFSQKDLREAIFTEANMRETNLSGSDLRGAIFVGAALQKTNLSTADFRDSESRNSWWQKLKSLIDPNTQNWQATNLSFVDFRGANFHDAKLQGAILQYADLTEAKYLLPRQLMGTDLRGAKLPDSFIALNPMATVDEACRNGRRLLLIMMFICVYTLFNLINTSDARLLANLSTSALPVFGTTLPADVFYIAFPLLLLFIYIYLHLHMQRYIWEEIAYLPAYFPSGKPLDKLISPWLITSLVRFHFNRLKHRVPLLSFVQVFLSILFTWILVPIILIILGAKYIPRHNWNITVIHIVSVSLAISAGVYLFSLACTTLKGMERRHFDWRDLWMLWKHGLAFIIIITLFYIISYGAINGTPTSIVPRILDFATFNAFPNFEEIDVSTRPAGWLGHKIEELPMVKGVNLKNRDLKYLKGLNTFLVNADISYADLRWADLQFADLRGANLFMAKLEGCNLTGANLQWANLQNIHTDKKTNFNNANLIETNFYNSTSCTILKCINLSQSKFKKANLGCIRLERADLTKADIEGANLGQACLNNSILTSANLKNADLVKAELCGADLMAADLSGADLEGANLEGANLIKAKLIKANLKETNLKKTNLEGADLRGAKGLTMRQLEGAVIIDAILPKYLVYPKKNQHCPVRFLHTMVKDDAH